MASRGRVKVVRGPCAEELLCALPSLPYEAGVLLGIYFYFYIAVGEF